MIHAINFKDMIGLSFNELTVIEFAGRNKFKRALWQCLCSCGNTTVVSSLCLRNGDTKSCGCLNIKLIKERFTKHGFSQGKNTIDKRFYSIWQNMKNRCLNSKDAVYFYYGARGIKVCDGWLESFENFRDDMYESYLKHVKEFGFLNTSLDRIDSNGNYIKDNCKWSTDLEQARNKRNTSATENYDLHISNRRKIRGLISHILKHHNYNSPTLERYLGLSIIEFRNYIQSLWEPWMTWNNYGQGKGKWEIDHIEECNRFDLSKENNLLICFNYKNLRPYDSIKNRERAYNIL